MFERFSGEARTTVALAQVQARDLGHDYIGTEHLLLALLATEGTTVRPTLGSFGVSADDVRTQILEIVGRGEGAGSGHIPFTPRSKKVLELSLREALALRHDTITPEHILLGLLREGEGLAAQILFKEGVDLVHLRQRIIAGMPPGEPAGAGGRRGWRRRGPGGGPFRNPDPMVRRMTRGAAQAADRALERAGGDPVASQHYLLGLLDDNESAAAKALSALGVTREQVEAKLNELGTRGTTDEPPEQWGAQNTSLEVEGDLVTVRIGDADLANRIDTLYQRLHVEILRGPQFLPGADRIWKALRPAVEASVRELEQSPATTWEPPGWSKSGAATYTVVSKPTGPAPQLWVAPDVDEGAVKAFLADWLTPYRDRTGGEGPVVYLTVNVTTAGAVVPEAADPDAFIVSHWSCGPGGPRPDWPRVPLADLVTAAIADLTG